MNHTPTSIEARALELLTDRQFQAWILWHRGAGYRRVAKLLGISTSTARDRIDRALLILNTDQETAA